MTETTGERTAAKGEPGGASVRQALKALLFGVSWILVSPLALLSWLESALSRGEAVFITCGQFLALFPGWPGVQLRGAFYCSSLVDCSWQVHVGFGSIFTHRGVKLAARVSMGSYCVIGHADIGPGVMMGSRVSIPSGKRQHFDDDGRIVAEARYDTVKIGDGCWIGEGAIILADVGQGCILSAGAVVVKPMPAQSVIGGNPAQVLRSLV